MSTFDRNAAASLYIVVKSVTDKVRELHMVRTATVWEPGDWHEVQVCCGCGAGWPCPTILLLDEIDSATDEATHG